MPSNLSGIYPPDSVNDVAHGLPIDNLGQGAADLLASDVEYRLHLITQEAKKFMVHAKRTTLTSDDVEYAMEVLNLEPILVPPRPLPQPTFAQVQIPTVSGNSTHTIYYAPDDEIDFATYLKQPLPPGLASSAGVKWKAHWLAVEGVQPAIPENPAPSARVDSTSPLTLPSTGSAALRPSARSHLPQELQLYFGRLTAAIVPSTSPPPSPDGTISDVERQRLAALASLRGDQAVGGILVYLVKWIAESVQKCLMSPVQVLGYLLDAMEALLDNEAVFVEPYLHQLLAPLMSILLTVPLGPHPPTSSQQITAAYETRLRASDVLRKIVDDYSSSYPNLTPRLLSTLSQALQSDPFPSPLGANHPPAGRYEGALLGISALGSHAVRTCLWGEDVPRALQRLDDLASRLYPTEGRKGKSGLMKAAIKAMGSMIGPKPENFTGGSMRGEEIVNVFGSNWSRVLEKRPWLGSEMMRMYKERREGMDVDGVGV
ncbi:hypothetical protein TREMEDRAFT_70674 [Tremella mesenterica DSM 1558]|uniref:uncharacterized protein n=1 Tax=Tremella mesenterica (strain ATCC 24925 / CBS 8224 / DSM 1558 / NBRC 9311 / NRRL Y-6157 / RJB 2259-6 / UBC 559-6) TaxID=578456 RepID=UPI0003F4A344|nr:uncharacterized protein TREMEDRAFT_70674 [Tremella mesenterica DSM 1558]EIW72312.1 hypothetical protein TREMEDRAFT_70674 [Tremella mesenterica DSM 1558]